MSYQGTFKEFRLGDLFEVKLGINIPNKELLGYGKHKVITGTTINNGVGGYINDLNGKDLVSNYISMSNRGEYSGTAFYQLTDSVLGSNVIGLFPNFEMSRDTALYIITELNRLHYGGYSNYPTKTSVVKDVIYLPTLDGENPDYAYMEIYIKQTERSYITKLKEYYDLRVSKLLELVDLTKLEFSVIFGGGGATIC